VGQTPIVATAVGNFLADLGARRCFGVLGTANFKVTHALSEAGVEFIAAGHEGNAATMGDAYARMSGELTLVSVHSGPGLTNAITGIGEAAKSRTPLLVLAGDVATGDTKSNFHIEQAELVRSVGAEFHRVNTASTALSDTQRAVVRALRDRRTVVLSLPSDVQDAEIQNSNTARQMPSALPAMPPHPTAIAKLFDAIQSSERPLILAGRGALLAKEPLMALGDCIGALLATSACAHGLFAENPWSLGISGGFASPAALELIPQSDLILGFGVSFTQWTTRQGSLISPDAEVVQIDIDVERLGIHQALDYSVLGDARATAEALLLEFDRRGTSTNRKGRWRTSSTRKRIELGSTHNAPYSDTSSSKFIDPRTMTKAIDNIIPSDRIIVTDAGHSMGWAPLYLRVPDQHSRCQLASFQSVGLGLATAIGAGLSHRGRLVVLATGDGGLMMSISDLATAIHLGLRMCILVFNDAAYGAEVHYYRRRGFSTDIVTFPETDFAAIARGFGARGTVVRTVADLEPLRAWVAEGASGVFIVDAKVDSAVEADWFQDAFKITD
jgi:thiamine pyrophosphate-dependent acetolactate synthase large subunit-like protein